MEYYLKLFRNHEEYEEYKREHPEPTPEPPYIPPVPLPSYVIKYLAASKVNVSTNNFDANIMVHDFKYGVGTILFDGDVTIINDNAFRDSSITSIEIPDSIGIIGSNAFRGCYKIGYIRIPDVTTIANAAFLGCLAMTSCTIDGGVEYIGPQAFQDCISLTRITINVDTPPTISNNSFDNTNDCPIYVPNESVDDYKTANRWSNYASKIQPIP